MDASRMARVWLSRRVVLWAGFGGLLLLMIVIAFNADRALRRIEATNARVRQETLRRDDLLDTIRYHLYQSSIDVRDYLLDPRAETRRREIENSRRRMYAAASLLRGSVSSAEVPAVDKLQRDLDDYWTKLEPVFGWDAALRRLRGDGFLRDEVYPRHEQLVKLAERIAALDNQQLQAGTADQARVFREFRDGLTASALLAIAIGLALASLSIRRILALERTSEIRYREVVLARSELRRLSARLVAAQEEERRRLSRELHDEVGQAMSAVLMELGNLDSGLPAEAGGLRDSLLRARRLAERSVGSVRNMALLLRPSMLDDLGLIPALKWQAREMSRQTGMKVKVAAEEMPDDLPDDFRTCIYRVVQESLRNASRHAQAKAVRVTVRRENGSVTVAVQDNGVGFDPRHDKGMGILGMEERVRSLKGIFSIDSEAGTGTVVSVLLPLAGAAVNGRSH